MKIKNLLVVALAAVLAMGSLSSCGKKTATDAMRSGERKVEQVKSLQLEAEKPVLRSFGEGEHNKMSFARQYAEAAARASYAAKFGTAVLAAASMTTDGAQISHSDMMNQSAGEDEGVLSNASVEAITKGVVKNTAVINTDVFQRPDGKYHVYVCIEYAGNVADLARDLTDNYKKQQIGQQVSDEDRAKMEVRAEEFRKRVEDRLNQLNGGTTF